MKYLIEEGTIQQAQEIRDITNEAFIADTFFKKPEYHMRFDFETVQTMINTQDSVFLIAKTNENEIVGSIYLNWDIIETDDSIQITGKFSAVSVPPRCEKKGIGKALVKGAESKVLSIANSVTNNSPKKLEISLQMGVINLRKDLFPWYENQGFITIGEIRPNDP